MAVKDDVLSRAKKSASSSGSRSPIAGTAKLCAMLLIGIAKQPVGVPHRGNAGESIVNDNRGPRQDQIVRSQPQITLAAYGQDSNNSSRAIY
jgi:hypothetical protein